MVDDLADAVIRVTRPTDVPALAMLRALWGGDTPADSAFVGELADWLLAEGDRRTTWLATVDATPVGMASLFEYRRMPRPDRPDSRWGYVSNMFVRDQFRNRGIGSALLNAILAAADEREYVRLVLSPSPDSIRFYKRAGFVVPGEAETTGLLLVRLMRR